MNKSLTRFTVSMVKKIYSTHAGVHLIEGFCLIRGPNKEFLLGKWYSLEDKGSY